MCSNPSNLSNGGLRGREAAFTVTELMVAISILAVIVIALYSVFNITQKALRSNESQVDIGERGRAVIEMISRELEQSVATRVAGETNMFGGIGNPPWSPTPQSDLNGSSNSFRVNTLHQLYFENQQTTNWSGIGYKLVDATNGVGSLFRYSYTTNRFWAKSGSNLLSRQFFGTIPTYRNPQTLTNYHHIADGVVHFKLTAFDPSGRRMTYDMTNAYPKYFLKALSNSGGNRTNSTATPLTGTNVFLQQAMAGSAAETRFAFTSNGLPAYVEIELGLLEPQALKQFEAISQDGPAGAGLNFLRKRVNQVHLYRRRVPIPTAVQ